MELGLLDLNITNRGPVLPILEQEEGREFYIFGNDRLRLLRSRHGSGLVVCRHEMGTIGLS